MPTTLFCRLLLDSHDDKAESITEGALKALIRVQIHERDLVANGAFRGLPGHPTLGESAFCWDSEFALLLLQKVLGKDMI